MKLRVARHIQSFEFIIPFYTQVLTLEVLGKFEEHERYSGIFLGKKEENWHLEFTISDAAPVHAFDEDDMLVFYPNTKEEFDLIQRNIINNQVAIETAKNPYWNRNGLVVKDPEGYWIGVVDPNAKLT
jgi:hypothetical protein